MKPIGIKIKTITPIHIGNGKKYDDDFFVEISKEKVNIFDLDYDSIDLNFLISNIENLEIIKEKSKKIIKSIPIYKESYISQSIDRFIYTYNGENEINYIPGSSIKGYIFNSILWDKEKIVLDNELGENIIISDFLPSNYTYFASSVNIYSLTKNGQFKLKTRSFAEIVTGEFYGSVALKNEMGYDYKRLFKIISEFTEWSINNELRILNNYDKTFTNEYISKLLEIRDMINNGKIILRLGKYTGSLYKSLIKLIENKNEKEVLHIINDIIRRRKPYKYPRVPFPKTVKTLSDGLPLGFVELIYDEK